MMSSPAFVRLDYAYGTTQRQVTLLVKANSLLLKYAIQGVRMKLSFKSCAGRLLYGLTVFDDDSFGPTLWTFAESQSEVSAILKLAAGNELAVALFNEVGVNTSFNIARMEGDPGVLKDLLGDASIGSVDHMQHLETVESELDRIHDEPGKDGWIGFNLVYHGDWCPVRNYLSTSEGTLLLVDMSDDNEGRQQEDLAFWLAKNLMPASCHHSPQVASGPRMRELTDILLGGDFGAILIESKSLTILGRSKLPNRQKLRRDIAQHIKKAVSQLKGALRLFQTNAAILDLNGELIEINRATPAHAIVLVPDLDLLDAQDYGADLIIDFTESTNSYIHIIDPSELFRLVQAALKISKGWSKLGKVDALDYYLTERFKLSLKSRTLRIEVILEQ